ncbi:MAG: hypothetical protein NTW32_26880 [Chloroflexi bacterium]|nr:hypothetical protein [Chloroflexota bacterium]
MNEKVIFRPFLVSAIILFFGGWGGLVFLLNFSLPTLWPRWGLYALIVLAGTGTILPIAYWLNVILIKTTPGKPGVIVRESISGGVYLAILAWLSVGRVLNLPIAIWLALGLILIEYMLRLREAATKSENVPPQPPVS